MKGAKRSLKYQIPLGVHVLVCCHPRLLSTKKACSLGWCLKHFCTQARLMGHQCSSKRVGDWLIDRHTSCGKPSKTGGKSRIRLRVTITTSQCQVRTLAGILCKQSKQGKTSYRQHRLRLFVHLIHEPG